VAVAIEADQTSFQFYHGGVLSAKKCGVKLDHGVLAVGYGVDAKTKMKYWIVKNSWGGMWGDKGELRCGPLLACCTPCQPLPCLLSVYF